MPWSSVRTMRTLGLVIGTGAAWTPGERQPTSKTLIARDWLHHLISARRRPADLREQPGRDRNVDCSLAAGQGKSPRNWQLPS